MVLGVHQKNILKYISSDPAGEDYIYKLKSPILDPSALLVRSRPCLAIARAMPAVSPAHSWHSWDEVLLVIYIYIYIFVFFMQI